LTWTSIYIANSGSYPARDVYQGVTPTQQGSYVVGSSSYQYTEENERHYGGPPMWESIPPSGGYGSGYSGYPPPPPPHPSAYTQYGERHASNESHHTYPPYAYTNRPVMPTRSASYASHSTSSVDVDTSVGRSSSTMYDPSLRRPNTGTPSYRRFDTHLQNDPPPPVVPTKKYWEQPAGMMVACVAVSNLPLFPSSLKDDIA
jgi:hypothetical protein